MDLLKPRQAVVIIHGIGEQLPMQTLRGFVQAVVGGGRDAGFNRRAESKPDHISPTLELRRMAVPGKGEWTPGAWVSTDFYELYWAHLMTGTTWQHVSAWVARLLLRNPCAVPARLKAAWVVCWFTVFAAVFFLLRPLGTGEVTLSSSALFAAVVAAVLWLCRQTATYFGLQYAGDAARYLSPRPENVGVRHAIRCAAIELLEGLHNDPTWRRYDRIIVVGHSLGSVIAYDALTHLWQRRHHPKPDYAPCKNDLAADESEDSQLVMWREQRCIGVEWKITDFVTLGSPLAHASFLMADGPSDLAERVAQREFPTCPPQPNDARDFQYGKPLLVATHGGTLLHHAALFACTRWTNLYFDKDIIGGAIEDLGHGINNRRLEPRGFFPHTKYWSPGTDPKPLREALDLCDWWKSEANASSAIRSRCMASQG